MVASCSRYNLPDIGSVCCITRLSQVFFFAIEAFNIDRGSGLGGGGVG